MQTTLDCIPSSSVPVTVEPRNSTIQLTDEQIDYLYETQSPERCFERQIEQHFEDIENEEIEIKRRYEGFMKYEKPQYKPQEYIRVGKKC